MDDSELQLLVEEVSLKYFEKPFLHKASFNSRLRTTGGRYLLKSNNIEINRRYYNEFGIEETIGIIKHELCHYHLHIEGRGYKHGDRDFKQLLKKVGGPRYCLPIEGLKKKSPSKLYMYECENCKTAYNRRRRVNLERYVCGSCSGRLIMKGMFES